MAGSYAVGDASFGPSVADVPVSGNVVLAIDNAVPTGDACSTLVNAAALNGNIAMVDRGTCAFAVKVQAAQDAGAIGVIVVNNVTGPAASMGGSSATITIPAVMISQADGNLLKTELANGLYVSLGVSSTRRAGMDAAGRPLVYTPNPLQSGSSVSHFDMSASPNLLMEPAINGDLAHNGVDLTLALFRDLGWFIGTTTPVPGMASHTVLKQNAPNPFNPSTTIRFTLAEAGDTELRVFDVRGQHVRRLVAGSLAAGDHSVVWDGRNDSGATGAVGDLLLQADVGGLRGPAAHGAAEVTLAWRTIANGPGRRWVAGSSRSGRRVRRSDHAGRTPERDLGRSGHEFPRALFEGLDVRRLQVRSHIGFPACPGLDQHEPARLGRAADDGDAPARRFGRPHDGHQFGEFPQGQLFTVRHRAVMDDHEHV